MMRNNHVSVNLIGDIQYRKDLGFPMGFKLRSLVSVQISDKIYRTVQIQANKHLHQKRE
jgi:hypothetical protein